MDSTLLNNIDLSQVAKNTAVSDSLGTETQSNSTNQPQPAAPTEGWHAEPQVNWLLATSPKKVNWLRFREQEARTTDGSKMSR